MANHLDYSQIHSFTPIMAMKLEQLLHRLSHLKWFFLVLQIALIIYCLVVRPPNLVSLIGFALFATGIYLGLDGLSDVKKTSETLLKKYAEPEVAATICKIILSAVALVGVISLLFMSFRFIFPVRPIFQEFFDLGVDCWGLILGLICLLKSTQEKKAYAISQLKTE